MPKKKNQETQKEQSERFNQTAADLVAAGELNPTEADQAFGKNYCWNSAGATAIVSTSALDINAGCASGKLSSM